jgi:hypothetical protein
LECTSLLHRIGSGLACLDWLNKSLVEIHQSAGSYTGTDPTNSVNRRTCSIKALVATSHFHCMQNGAPWPIEQSNPEEFLTSIYYCSEQDIPANIVLYANNDT